jgi:hypothetical protein
MDDLAGALIGILFAVMLIVAAIYILIYLVVPAAICFFIGRTFYRQIKNYQLGKKSKTALGLVGAASILISTVVILGEGCPGLLIAPLSGILFILMAIPTLGLWAYSKRKFFYDLRESLRQEQSRIEADGRKATTKTDQAKNKINRIKQDYEDLLREKDRLEGIVTELCGSDAQTYSLLRREWERQFTGLSKMELERHQKELGEALKRLEKSRTHEKTEKMIRHCLATMEVIGRIIGRPLQEMAEAKTLLDELERAGQRLSRETARVAEQIRKNDGKLANFNRSRVVLD